VVLTARDEARGLKVVQTLKDQGLHDILHVTIMHTCFVTKVFLDRHICN